LSHPSRNWCLGDERSIPGGVSDLGVIAMETRAEKKPESTKWRSGRYPVPHTKAFRPGASGQPQNEDLARRSGLSVEVGNDRLSQSNITQANPYFAISYGALTVVLF
jgi:hypothetical protein